MHVVLLQFVRLLKVLVAGDPLLYVCMKEGAAVFFPPSTNGAGNVATKDGNLSSLWFSAECEKIGLMTGKLSCVISALIVP